MYLILRIYKCEKLYSKKENLCIYFSIVHISVNFALRGLTHFVAIGDIHIEGTVSQNSDFSSCFMSKNGQLVNQFLNVLFSKSVLF